MEKEEIKLTLDEYRMRALTHYLKQENTTVQAKMTEALRQLYDNAVPEEVREVREFLDAMAAPQRPKRPPRPSQPKAQTAVPDDREKGAAADGQ